MKVYFINPPFKAEYGKFKRESEPGDNKKWRAVLSIMVDLCCCSM